MQEEWRTPHLRQRLLDTWRRQRVSPNIHFSSRGCRKLGHLLNGIGTHGLHTVSLVEPFDVDGLVQIERGALSRKAKGAAEGCPLRPKLKRPMQIKRITSPIRKPE